MIDRPQLLRDYKSTPNFSRLAKIHGVSRQCIQQLFKREYPHLKSKFKRSHTATHCKICERPFTGVRYVMKDLCQACYQYERATRNRSHIRTIFYPTQCVFCSKPLIARKRTNGMCLRCDVKYKYKTNPVYRSKILAGQKRWQREHREKVSLYNHRNYIKRKYGRSMETEPRATA